MSIKIGTKVIDPTGKHLMPGMEAVVTRVSLIHVEVKAHMDDVQFGSPLISYIDGDTALMRFYKKDVKRSRKGLDLI